MQRHIPPAISLHSMCVWECVLQLFYLYCCALHPLTLKRVITVRKYIRLMLWQTVLKVLLLLLYITVLLVYGFYGNCVLRVFSCQCPCVPICFLLWLHVCLYTSCFLIWKYSAVEISSGPRSVPWVSPLASATGVISEVSLCVALFIYVLARLPQYL